VRPRRGRKGYRSKATPEETETAATIAADAGGKLRIAFVSTMCLLDQVSGAAISMRSALETLAAAGHQVSAFTASSQGRKMTSEEAQRLYSGWHSWLARARPEIVVSFGTSKLSRQLQAAARDSSVRIVLYFGNAEIDVPDLVHPGDRAICCSAFLAELYRERYVVEAEVMYPVVRPERSRRLGLPVLADHPELRQLGFVTFINPIPYKGLTLVRRMIDRAGRERPGVKFLIIEGLAPREIMARMKVDLPGRPNVWWLPAQLDMAAVYSRSAVLLMPSFWREGFGRAVVEEQSAGVPVLADDIGGLPEALGGSNTPLPIPERCIENHHADLGPETVEAWFTALTALWDDDEAYRRAVAQTRETAERFSAEATRARVLEIFTAIGAAVGDSR